MSKAHAVIFTHCSDLKYDDLSKKDPSEHDPNFFQNNVDRYIHEYSERFKCYLKCNEKDFLIGIVYGYIDLGVQSIIPQSSGKNFKVTPDIIEKERALKDVLQFAKDEALQQLSITEPPKFKFIGLDELVGLLNRLTDVDPDLVQFLCGKKGSFTYDSPKFVEAVIRLARGDIPHLAQHPIIRVDDDAKVNPESIDLLLREFEKISKKSPFYFFSGRYGREDSQDDPINDYAVRTHWFFSSGTNADESEFKSHVETCQIFLADLDVLGAQQPLVAQHQYSKELTSLVNEGKLSLKTRPAPQVISGAGLCMGRRNVELLPPFMNFGTHVIWVDDHLKRDLHEKLGDIAKNYLESIDGAKFQQDRSPQKECSWYLERLIRGCMLHAIIEDDSDDPKAPSYSQLIRDIVWFKKGSLEIDEEVQGKMRERLLKVSVERYKIVLQCWSSDEFRNYESFDWATQQLSELENPNGSNQKLWEEVAEDAMDYITLILSWHKFTRAIERLPFIGNLWLYER